MKYEKTPEDIKVEQHDLQHDRTMKHLRDANFYKFQVGDVLARLYRVGDEWKVEEAQCGLPVRYVYAFENELGLGYIRRMSIDGKRFVGSAQSVLEFDPVDTKFELDASYADHLILSGEDEQFDTKSGYAAIKSKKAKVKRMNEKIRMKFATEDEAETFLKGMKVGDKFWYGGYSTDLHKEASVVTTAGLEPSRPGAGRNIIPGRHFIEYKSHSYGGWMRKLYASQLVSGWFFTQQPHIVDDLL